MAPRTFEMHEAICADATAKVPHAVTCQRLKVGAKYVTQVRQYFLQTGEIPRVGFTPMATTVRRASRTGSYSPFPIDEAKLHLAELKAAEREQKEREARRPVVVNPTLGGAFPVPLSRLMGRCA
jgi:hypothetical protein